jgi:hypothetical protein
MKGKIYVFVTALLIGVSLGYAWRMRAIEPLVAEETSFLYKQNQRLSKDLTQLELRIVLLEEQIRGLRLRDGSKDGRRERR